MGCLFCATGRIGFVRDLSSEEIADQVLFWRQYLNKEKRRSFILFNIVYMGMGEPFLNWEQVKKSLVDLTDASLFGFGARNISVSTAGIPEGIERLADEFPQVNLALSLHFASEEKRSRYMPINKRYPLDSLKNTLGRYLQKTRRKVFLEYLLLDNINDTQEDADQLIEFIRSIGSQKLLHVNLIRYNVIGGMLRSSSKSRVERFKKCLLERRIHVTIRKSLGREIQGACGQLAGER